MFAMWHGSYHHANPGPTSCYFEQRKILLIKIDPSIDAQIFKYQNI